MILPILKVTKNEISKARSRFIVKVWVSWIIAVVLFIGFDLWLAPLFQLFYLILAFFAFRYDVDMVLNKELAVIINIKKYGIDGTRIDLAHIDEKAENEPNRVKRHMKMEVAKFMRAVYNEILEEPEKYGLGQNINR